MKEYPEYLIFAVHRNTDQAAHIDKVKAFFHYHPEDRHNTTREYTKNQILELMESGAICMTGIEQNGIYVPHERVLSITIYGYPYLKVHKDAEPRDDLGVVEEF